MKFEFVIYNQYHGGLNNQIGYDFFQIVFRILNNAFFISNIDIRGTVFVFSFIIFGFGLQINFLLKSK